MFCMAIISGQAVRVPVQVFLGIRIFRSIEDTFAA